MNLLPLSGQEPAVLRLAQQVTALVSCLEELCAEYSIPASLPQNARAGLYRDGIALHDIHRYTYVYSLCLNIIPDHWAVFLHCFSVVSVFSKFDS